jgi:hypothetical protein
MEQNSQVKQRLTGNKLANMWLSANSVSRRMALSTGMRDHEILVGL